MDYPRKNPIYLKQVYTFLSNQINFENLKSSLPLKRFIFRSSTTLNPKKLKVRSKCISCTLLILMSTTTNPLHVYYVNIASYKILKKYWKNKDIVTAKHEATGAVILDRKLCDNVVQEIFSYISKFEKLNEDPTLKREASLQRFLRTLKQKNFFNKNEFDKLYPSGSTVAMALLLWYCCYGTPKMHKFSSSD